MNMRGGRGAGVEDEHHPAPTRLNPRHPPELKIGRCVQFLVLCCCESYRWAVCLVDCDSFVVVQSSYLTVGYGGLEF
jgi:hypothetical protein